MEKKDLERIRGLMATLVEAIHQLDDEIAALDRAIEPQPPALPQNPAAEPPAPSAPEFSQGGSVQVISGDWAGSVFTFAGYENGKAACFSVRGKAVHFDIDNLRAV